MARKVSVVERRAFGDYELRKVGDNGAVLFRGHAAVFDQTTTIGGAFRERVDPNAFNKTLSDRFNVKFLYNHDEDSVMASVKTGSLRLDVDERGLVTEADLPHDDVDVQRLVPKIQRGDVDEMSFAFRSIVDEWDETPEDGGLPIRTLKEVQLFDVSPVTFPAYEGTDAEAVSNSLMDLSVRKLCDARPEVRKILEERQPLLKKDSPFNPETPEEPETSEIPEEQPVIEQVPAQQPDEAPEPKRSLVDQQQALLGQVLSKIELSLSS